MNWPEISPQINNLPSSKSNKCSHDREGKPLHTLICRLVRIAQFLLARSQVLHLTDNLWNNLLNASQLNFDRLEFLGSLNGRPVTRISANINIKLNRTGWAIWAAWWFKVLLAHMIRRTTSWRSRNIPSSRLFSKHTSKAALAWEVNAILASPTTSLGRPYSFPTASLI